MVYLVHPEGSLSNTSFHICCVAVTTDESGPLVVYPSCIAWSPVFLIISTFTDSKCNIVHIAQLTYISKKKSDQIFLMHHYALNISTFLLSRER